jgi:hypothetical protein
MGHLSQRCHDRITCHPIDMAKRYSIVLASWKLLPSQAKFAGGTNVASH